MGICAASLSSGTVHLRRTPVNRLVTVNAAAGDRLRRFVESRWGRSRGGMRGVCAAIGVVPETLYGWFRGDNDPSLGALAALADVLGVSRYEIVAAIDGEGPVVRLDEETRRAIREEIAAVLGQEPPAAPGGPSGGG